MGRKSDARERLINAALELIWRDSYGGVTVDALCDHAEVNKGTFYHFFDSKSDLTIVAITSWWRIRRSEIEKQFRPEVPPLDRICDFVALAAEAQIQAYEKTGRIIGVPIYRIGTEICNHHEPLRKLVAEIIDFCTRYFEQAISEAQASDQAGGKDSAVKARLLWGFYISTLTRAYMQNDPEMLRNLAGDVRKLIQSELFTRDLDPQQKEGADAAPSRTPGVETKPKRTKVDGRKENFMGDHSQQEPDRRSKR